MLNDSGKKRNREKEMDAYAAELARAHKGSLQLEQKYEMLENASPVGAKSSNNAVEHLGAGVFLEKYTPAIDDVSKNRQLLEE